MSVPDDSDDDLDLDDLLPGFESRWIPTEAGRSFVRLAGAGEPVVLVHGFPQTMVEWHRIAPALATRFTVVLLDLRGYGWSSAPTSDPLHETYSKRAMGRDVVRVMETLGHARFAFVGHDRGARVGYRLALEQPGRLTKLAVLDIVPTLDMWEMIERPGSTIAPHWRTLAMPAPGPETEIGRDPDGMIDRTLAAWTATKSLDAFDQRALQHYRTFMRDPSRIHACCEDYRAGATLDREQDAADRAAGRTIDVPLLALWGSEGIPASGIAPLDAWRRFAPRAEGEAIESGHFLPEENPDATLARLMAFL